MMINAFYSDPHFGHKNIINLSARPFANIEHMHQELITRYNQVIAPHDVVMWLGDCAFCKPTKLKNILDGLNGKKILVRGNHDKSHAVMSALGFDVVMDECFMTIAGRSCRLKHFPYLDSEPPGIKRDDRYANKRPPRIAGEILIHGHTHSKRRMFKNSIHVGVDAWDFRPVLFSEIEKIINEM